MEEETVAEEEEEEEEEEEGEREEEEEERVEPRSCVPRVRAMTLPLGGWRPYA